MDPHPGLIIAVHEFSEPYPLVSEIELLSFAVMDLLNVAAYPAINGYCKFSISLTLLKSNKEEFTLTLGPAKPLTYHNSSQFLPKNEVYTQIQKDFQKNAENYDGVAVIRVFIRVYMDGTKKDRKSLSNDERCILLSSLCSVELGAREPAREIRNRQKHSYLSYITKMNASSKPLKPFLVGDIETVLMKEVHKPFGDSDTVLMNEVHKPYAAGLMLVRPNDAIGQISMKHIDTYFSEDYDIIIHSFEDRSQKVLNDLVLRISALVRENNTYLTVYFHNFSRFDGILLLKHLACHHTNYKLKPLMRNNRLYEIAVYSVSSKKLLFRFRDSLHHLPGKLDNLAKSLCPDLGRKGTIPYDEVRQSNLKEMKSQLLDYMKQDIRLLGGVMRRAQEIYWSQYKIDIDSVITLSALALTIFRMKFYDPTVWPIHIPTKNEDNFIRKAYYGGHTDAYIPYGENLYYYDVNSLYPFIMKEYDMPGGTPVWHGNLAGKDLDSLYGFIDAYVECPKTIKRPFLPYRDKNNTLIFPTGEFIGVYYSEELKYAKSLGYRVIPLSGYLFDRKGTPFRDFVSSLYESRLNAKKSGNEALSFVYKIIMNSLYGRFGINPKCTITEICDEDRKQYLFKNSEFLFIEQISKDYYIVVYHSNTGRSEADSWDPPKNSAVQLAAAITASARIHMYTYTSREDCYYTDTDSVVLSNPLPEEMISASELGKLKLEDKIVRGFFLAPKTYCYYQIDGNSVIKFKGPAKNLVDPEWFESQYEDLSRTKEVMVESNFRIDWHKLDIFKKDMVYNLGLPVGTKRELVFKDQTWVDTNPVHIIDLSRLDNTSKLIIQEQKAQIKQLRIINEKLIRMRGEQDERMKTDSGMQGSKDETNPPNGKNENQKPITKRRKWTMFPDLYDNDLKDKADNEKPPD
ncbi:uncharacterized protein LOC107624706 [Arachis ipaensis]|uniref:uncharacterized protein LOC107624706 n=1 Tax=Arachis ipaensis TaxID=130454 RepID=UPI0007AF8378|nr:uncharacterized protein LOC107624706 [Arachis ipaensis]